MYLFGIGTDKDLQLAYHHLTSAAAKGNTFAKGYLAAYYYKRQMYGRTISLGRELLTMEDFKSSAKTQGCPVDHVMRGVSIGCYYYALCCQYGYGTLKDCEFAKDLIKKVSSIKHTEEKNIKFIDTANSLQNYYGA
ncbi:LRP2-binding protein isoform X4 [Trichonephila inaurata madagascariensis]|uniref:LRP2-binding protein n=1 Tax=Trichonephila inaurata madagascariensis TaxID=2747483 RepID=A0A8X6YRM0_9ARAC|nr:LRP2-binding protein isoform X4 [Trichonephila inaurata madagascariensis]